jgi:hypothetical protein
MSPRKSAETSSTLVDDLIRSAVLGFAFGAVLFMLSHQTGIVGSLLHSLGLPGVGNRLGVKQFVLFGICSGVTLDLVVKLLGRDRRVLPSFFTRRS